MDRKSSYTPSRAHELRNHVLWRLIVQTTDRYLQLLKENREKGYRGQQQNYIPGVTGPELGGSTGLPDVPGYYPVVQEAMGDRGTDKRKGATVGAGKDPY
jgi:hypothetical protein